MPNLALADLNERQSAFVSALLTGASPAAAAAAAGYSDESAGISRLMNSPAVLAALHEGVQRSLERDAPINLRLLRKIRDDDGAPARVRADIGLKLLSLAGHVQPTAKEQRDSKPLSQMTRDEMVDFINENEAKVEAAERELMARATDVTPAPSVVDSVPKAEAKASKPLSFLD